MVKKILIVDDEEIIIKSLKKLLEKNNFEVFVAKKGQDALVMAEEENFDLIISDIRMPGMDGIETLKRIRDSSLQHSKDKVPAIIITGYAGEDDVYKRAAELGITDFIYKPFELDEFIQIIRRNLEKPIKPKEIILDYKLLEPEFVSLTKNMKEFLQEVKHKFDEFDRENKDEQKQIEFIQANKKEIFAKLDDYFAKTWEYVKDFERDKYIVHQNYYQQKLHPLLEEIIEINRHIYRKPLGYPGDYIMMNYIYDYNGDENYLGNSSYEKLINNYTCNIPISCSNIKRKEFLKEKIIETLEKKNGAKILSVGCGPARELIELLNDGKIIKPLLFKCLDFEKKALDYIADQIEKIEFKKRQLLSIEYICRDITSIIKDRKLKEKLRDQDLIYSFGIFDYLSDRMASRLTKELYQLLGKRGRLIICNISLENCSHRAYYELLGEWNMVHRTKDEMLSWTNGIENVREIKFEELISGINYLFLVIERL